MHLASWRSLFYTQRKKQSDDVHCQTGRGYNSALATYYHYNLSRRANLTSGMLEVFGNIKWKQWCISYKEVGKLVHSRCSVKCDISSLRQNVSIPVVRALRHSLFNSRLPNSPLGLPLIFKDLGWTNVLSLGE